MWKWMKKLHELAHLYEEGSCSKHKQVETTTAHGLSEFISIFLLNGSKFNMNFTCLIQIWYQLNYGRFSYNFNPILNYEVELTWEQFGSTCCEISSLGVQMELLNR